MLQNAYFLAKIGADTTENEQDFAEILPTDAVSGGARRTSRPDDVTGRAPVPGLPEQPGFVPESAGEVNRRDLRGKKQFRLCLTLRFPSPPAGKSTIPSVKRST